MAAVSEEGATPIFFEDVLAETGTHRVDWVVGIQEINRVLGERNTARQVVPAVLQAGGVDCRAVVTTHGGRTPFMIIARREQLEVYARKRRPMRPVDASAAAETEVRQGMVTITGAPLLDKEQGRQIVLGLEALKRSNDTLYKGVGELKLSLDANTAAIEKQTRRMGEIFDGQK